MDTKEIKEAVELLRNTQDFGKWDYDDIKKSEKILLSFVNKQLSQQGRVSEEKVKLVLMGELNKWTKTLEIYDLEEAQAQAIVKLVEGER